MSLTRATRTALLTWCTDLFSFRLVAAETRTAASGSRLALPDTDNFTVEGRPAFLFLPPEAKRAKPQPWIFYAPTLPPYPDEAERWMHEQFLAAGVAVAGVDAG